MIIDKIRLHNNNEVFAYTGEESGNFIRQEENIIHVGTYEGAVPNIMDGMFKTEYKVTCKDTVEAQKRAMEAAGVEGLLDTLANIPNGYRTQHGNIIEKF